MPIYYSKKIPPMFSYWSATREKKILKMGNGPKIYRICMSILNKIYHSVPENAFQFKFGKTQKFTQYTKFTNLT